MKLYIKLFCLLNIVIISGCKNTSISNEGVADQLVKGKPNVLLIVADDLGYSDLGVYGGEIHTPNLDNLAKSGVQFTNFITAPTCSPTRSMLLSGTDNHIAGLGSMAEVMALMGGDEYKNVPGYEGYLNQRVVTLPSLLKNAGYHTYMAGKWHLGLAENQSPAERGFEESFSLLQGGASHLNQVGLRGPKALYREGMEIVKEFPKNFYSTDFYTKRMIKYIDSNHGDGQPFFGYLTYTAPHWPLMAKEETIARYKGRYSKGYLALQRERIAKMTKLGLLKGEEIKLDTIPKQWELLEEEARQKEERAMEIYAAMIEDMDNYIGRLVDHLSEIGELDNTLIIFMSDNGAEGKVITDVGPFRKWADQCCDASLNNMGKANSYVSYGAGWAAASNTPLRGFKGSTLQGGIRVPAFVAYPSFQKGKLYRDPVTVMDIMPTILEAAGITPPAQTYKGKPIAKLRGQSMLSMLKGNVKNVHSENYIIPSELFGNRSVQQGSWSAVAVGKKPADRQWKLYNLKQDISQSKDLSLQHPKRLKTMIEHWEKYKLEVGVVLPKTASPY